MVFELRVWGLGVGSCFAIRSRSHGRPAHWCVLLLRTEMMRPCKNGRRPKRCGVGSQTPIPDLYCCSLTNGHPMQKSTHQHVERVPYTVTATLYVGSCTACLDVSLPFPACALRPSFFPCYPQGIPTTEKKGPKPDYSSSICFRNNL